MSTADRGGAGRIGYYLFIDEAGDEGIERVRPIDPGGSPEYFVLCGAMIRAHRQQELATHLNDMKRLIGLSPTQELHFRKLTEEQQDAVVAKMAEFRVGLIAVVSNKRNMRGYRNHRVEAKNMETVNRGRLRPQSYNWFYNHTFRYLLETASAEAARWSALAGTPDLRLRIIFSYRKGFRYSQTQAYLHKLSIAKHGSAYFNNRREVTWSAVNPSDLEPARAKGEPGLQFADCAASAVYRAIDENWFGSAKPQLLEALAPRFVRLDRTPAAYGFKLLPSGYRGPLSDGQRRGLEAVGFKIPRPPTA